MDPMPVDQQEHPGRDDQRQYSDRRRIQEDRRPPAEPIRLLSQGIAHARGLLHGLESLIDQVVADMPQPDGIRPVLARPIPRTPVLPGHKAAV